MTSMNDGAITAKEEAAKELAKLLPSPESLAILATLRQENAQRQQANDAQLSSTVTAQVEQARSGIAALAAAQATITQLQENFVLIEQLCKECDALIENHDQIKQLNVVRNNLNKTLMDAEGMLSIQAEASEARASLSDSRELVKTYERLTALEGKRRFALAAASSRPEEAGKLREYFEDVNRTKETFEETLWGYIRDFFKLAKNSPQTLVRALKVVEMQEMLDEQVDEEEAEELNITVEELRSSREKTNTTYKDMCYQQIQMGVDDIFHDLLHRLVNEDLKATLEEATAISDQLPEIHKFVSPCFPPTYGVFDLVVQLYANHFVVMLHKLSDRAEQINNLDILKLVAWLNTCEEKMLQLGVEESVAMLPAESGALDPLIDEYVERMKAGMKQWLKNILDMDKQNPPNPGPNDGPLYTPVAVDVFRLFAEQVTQVQENSNSLMLFKVAHAVVELILDIQQQEKDYLATEPVVNMGLEALCAMVNNYVRCHDEAVELGNTIVESLEDKHAQEIDFKDACEGFLDIAKEAVVKIVELIFVDEGLKDFLAKMHTAEWCDPESNVTQTVIATLEDYFGDIQRWIVDRSFRRFCEACLERTVVIYVETMLATKMPTTGETLQQLSNDIEGFREFFQEFVSDKKLDLKLQPVLDLHTVAASDSTESFALGYTQLLKTCADCPPEVIEKLVHLREDIGKKEAKEVMEECKEVWNNHLAEHGDPKPSFLFSKVAIKK